MFTFTKIPRLKLLVKNIGTLVSVYPKAPVKLSGKEMSNLPVLRNAWLAIDEGRIADFGEMKDFPGISNWNGLEVIDAGGKTVMPCWVDSHTHIVYAGSRESEFVDRIKGLSYQEIAERGGGILNSAAKLEKATENELYDSALARIEQVKSMGTGAIEIKSGYGLSVDSELKMLRVIRRLKEKCGIPVRSTFLGAHAVPRGSTREAYIKVLINELIPAIGKEKLADYCDVFCESGYFTETETIHILEAAQKHGMLGKVHAEQLSHSGGIRAGVHCNAISVDHLEYISDDDIAILLKSQTMATILPGAQWFLQLPYPPARKMIDNGLPVAISSDYNPGSCPSGNMSFMVSLACVQYKMTPEEAINAATINSAYAMGLGDEVGCIAPGMKANLMITKEIPDYSFIPYTFATNLIERVITSP